MDINETLITKYAKKIYGFAYAKTNNYHDAQDLSQNILLALCSIDFTEKDISDMDGYIYRICAYSWSNFVRKNKPIWEGLGYMDEMEAMPGESSFEDEIINQELYTRLRREIAYLSENKRKIMLMFYYENMSGKEISEKLGIPASTVRWYIGESKKILKERFQMNDTIYTPKKLTVYFNGNSNDGTLAGLRDDLLVQNICIVCAKKARTIEEMAERLCMSAAFIENKLGPLLHMNYIEKIGTNKYKTTFFIQDTDYFTAKKRFEFTHIPRIAKAIYEAVDRHFGKIQEIGFIGCDLNKNFLMWAFTTMAAHDYVSRSSMPCKAQPPMRGDGSQHWIDASWQIDEIFKAQDTMDAEFAEYIMYSDGMAGKHNGNDKIMMQQFDPPAVCKNRSEWMLPEYSNLQRVHDIIVSKLEPSEHDKDIIAMLAQKGYVSVKDGVPTIMIPYFTADEYKAFRKIMDENILADVENEVGTELMKDYAQYIEKFIPDYLPDAEKEFLVSRFYQPNAYSYLLMKQGLLVKPSEDEAKRICTVVWER